MSNEHIHDEHCDCGCNHDEPQMMTLVLDDDSELQCAVLGVFDVEDKSYIALLPADNEEEGVYLYRYLEDDSEEGFILENIEDDAEFEAVEDVFYEIFYDEEEDLEDLEDTEE